MVDTITYAAVFYAAVAIFILGFIYRIIKWANIPVPLKITTTGSGYMENPKSTFAVLLRMASEILVFRTLFRNTLYDLETNKIMNNRILWLGAIVFHWSFLLIVLRHVRFFTEPVPSFIVQLQATLAISGVIILPALLYLLTRRMVFAEMRYISIFSDYFILLLILAIVITGNLVNYFLRIDLVHAKMLMLSLLAFRPIADDIHWLFALHLTLVAVLMAYFPFSKLMHAPGIFFSPTRNQKNDARVRRHVNPWNYPVKIDSWEEYSERFKEDFNDVGK